MKFLWWYGVGAVVIMIACLWTTNAIADEKATTWRKGDLVGYNRACYSLEVMTEFAENMIVPFFNQLLKEKKCYHIASHEGRLGFWLGLLIEWLSGPYEDGAGTPGSIWKLGDFNSGLSVYILLDNTTGPHKVLQGIQKD